MTDAELETILQKHADWLDGKPGGTRADLSNTDLSGRDLRGRRLSRANLTGANLAGANLEGAYLTRAYLTRAYLEGANLTRAYLEGASLTRAYLEGANMAGANLEGAYLTRAYLADDTTIDTGETWREYLSETLPVLLTAGGKSLESFGEHWQCHNWSNCPMHHAFDAVGENDCPILLRPRVRQFVQLFDARLIPCPAVPQSAAT